MSASVSSLVIRANSQLALEAIKQWPGFTALSAGGASKPAADPVSAASAASASSAFVSASVFAPAFAAAPYAAAPVLFSPARSRHARSSSAGSGASLLSLSQVRRAPKAAASGLRTNSL